jgi:AraC-like DNA-binding protein
MPKNVDDKPRLSPRQHHESFLGSDGLLQSVPILGYVRYLEAIPEGLVEEHHNAFEFHYIVRGELAWWAGSDVCDVRSNTVFMTHPGELHGSCDEHFEPCELYWLQLKVPEDGAFDHLSFAESQTLYNSLKGMSLRTFPASPQIRRCFEQLLEEHRQPAAFSHVVASATLHQLLVALWRAHRDALCRQRGQRLSDAVERAIHFINGRIDQPPTVEEVAIYAGISPGYLRVRFREELGLSPHEYLTKLRINQAKRLLINTRRSITRIAFDLGFSTSQNFASTFKQHVGVTPSTFRGQHATQRAERRGAGVTQ